MKIQNFSTIQFNRSDFANKNKSMQNPQKIAFKGFLDEDIFKQLASELACVIAPSLDKAIEKIIINRWLNTILEGFSSNIATKFIKLKVPFEELITVLE